MNKRKLLILTGEQEEFKTLIRSYNLGDLEIYAPENENEIQEYISDAEIILGNPIITSQYINQAKSLKWMQSTFAGIDAMNDDSLKKDYTLTNVRDVYGSIMSEYVFGYMIFLEKNILGNIENQAKKIWDQQQYPSLVGKKIGIMGTGSIGLKIAEVAKVFGMEVYGYSTTQRSKNFIDMMFTDNNKNDFLKDLDYLVSVLPNTIDTQGVINKSTFKQMKQSSVFINVGRGANINEHDFIKAIKNKEISGAVLDVFQTEPLPENSEIWDLENVLITPHISGNMSNLSSLGEIFKENYIRYNSGEKLLHTIDFTKGY